jgi:phenylalanyl-tRNA synthetase beta chain
LGERLQTMVLFDVYRGAGLPESAKSLAIGLILHEFSRTLGELEIEASISAVLDALANECRAVLRGAA